MEDKQEQPEKRLVWIESKTGPSPEIYGNYFNTSWTLFDVRFQIGALIPKTESDPTAGFVVEKRGAVTVAWPEVKVFLLTLVDLVRRYESVNGEIKPLKLTPAPGEENMPTVEPPTD